VLAVDALERRSGEQLGEPPLRALVVGGAQQHDDPSDVGQLAQALAEHGLAHEAGGSREEERLAGEALVDGGAGRVEHRPPHGTTDLY
jgi:hypothetical protein